MFAGLSNGTVEARFLLCIMKWVFVPADVGTVFLPIDSETRNYLYIWVRRFTFWAIFGYAVPEAAWWLGIPGALYALLLNTVGLILAVLAIIFLLQNRSSLAAWIAGEERAGASGWSRVRRTLGETWHLLAILYIIAAWPEVRVAGYLTRDDCSAPVRGADPLRQKRAHGQRPASARSPPRSAYLASPTRC
jgi:hypothetical protein